MHTGVFQSVSEYRYLRVAPRIRARATRVSFKAPRISKRGAQQIFNLAEGAARSALSHFPSKYLNRDGRETGDGMGGGNKTLFYRRGWQMRGSRNSLVNRSIPLWVVSARPFEFSRQKGRLKFSNSLNEFRRSGSRRPLVTSRRAATSPTDPNDA